MIKSGIRLKSSLIQLRKSILTTIVCRKYFNNSNIFHINYELNYYIILNIKNDFTDIIKHLFFMLGLNLEI